MEFSVLNPNGSFILLNPISKLLAGETQVLTLSFSPRESVKVSLQPVRWAPPHSGRQAGGGWGAQSTQLRPALAQGLPDRAPARASDTRRLRANGRGLRRPKKHWTSSPREAHSL